MSHYVKFDKRHQEWEVLGTMGNCVAAFKRESHAKIWAGCLNGHNRVVKGVDIPRMEVLEDEEICGTEGDND